LLFVVADAALGDVIQSGQPVPMNDRLTNGRLWATNN